MTPRNLPDWSGLGDPRDLPRHTYYRIKAASPLWPVLFGYHYASCDGCGCAIMAGHTAWTEDPIAAEHVTLCYGCGVGWEIYWHRLTLDQASCIPSIGGPIKDCPWPVHCHV